MDWTKYRINELADLAWHHMVFYASYNEEKNYIHMSLYLKYYNPAKRLLKKIQNGKGDVGELE